MQERSVEWRFPETRGVIGGAVWHSALGASLLSSRSSGNGDQVEDSHVNFCGLFGCSYEIGKWKRLEAG